MGDSKRGDDRARRDLAANALEALAQAGSTGSPPAGQADQASLLDHPPSSVSLTEPSSEVPGGLTACPPVRVAGVPRRADTDQGLQFKRVAIPPMLVMAAVMFLLGAWSILALCGRSFLVEEPSEAVDRLAKVMLLCWPVGILMVIGVWLFRRDRTPSRW